ncbi:MAG: tetratricopeptide repeat protein [Deltaproteobacteria bacterium]|nr:tetratricopeptide repeat protein [Deltaproteobacteria bacterium]
MAEQNVFTKKHADVVEKDKKAILEELSLPPAVIEFIRKNERIIKLALIVFVITVVAIQGYKKYTSVRTAKSSTLLYSALQTENGTQEVKLLKQLRDKYAGTGSGLWANIELGHLAFKNGNFAKAAVIFSAVIDKMAAKNTAYPLVQYSLAQSYENLGNIDKAKDAYLKLSQISGFAGMGDLGLARIYEKHGDPAQAVTYYKGYAELPETQPGPLKDWVLAKIDQLKK